MISYKPLLKLLVDRDLKKHDLVKILGLSTRTIAKFSANEYVSLEVIDKLCGLFKCQPCDIIEYVEDSKFQSKA